MRVFFLAGSIGRSSSFFSIVATIKHILYFDIKNELFWVALSTCASFWLGNPYIWLGTIAVLLIKAVFDGSFVLGISKRPLPIMAAFSVGAISIFVAPGAIPISSIEGMVTCVAMFVLGVCYAFSKDESWLRSGLLSLRFVVLISAVFCVIVEIAGQAGYPDYGVNGYYETTYDPFGLVSMSDYSEYRCRGLYRHPIVFSMMLAIGAVVSYYFSESNIERWGLICLFGVLTYFTRSRSGWIIVAGLLLLLMLSRIARPEAKIWHLMPFGFMVIVVAIGLCYAMGAFDAIVGRFDELNSDHSYSFRAGAIKYAINCYLEKPEGWLFGNGLYSDELILQGVNIGGIDSFDTLDNAWVTLLYVYGAIGVGCMIYALISALSLMRYGLGKRKWYLCCLFVLLVCLIEFAFFDLLSFKVPGSIMMIILGYLVSFGSPIVACGKKAIRQRGNRIYCKDLSAQFNEV